MCTHLANPVSGYKNSGGTNCTSAVRNSFWSVDQKNPKAFDKTRISWQSLLHIIHKMYNSKPQDY
jgi:hypothetical protein